MGTSVGREILTKLAHSLPGSVDELSAISDQAQLGIHLEVHPIKPQYTRAEESGFHLLLTEWLKMDPTITIGVERLKELVCRHMWGSIRLVGPGGQDEYISARRTTRKWDVERRAYVPSKLTREEYADLIEHTYRMAALDGIYLPDMEHA